jgi:hypothetical protein
MVDGEGGWGAVPIRSLIFILKGAKHYMVRSTAAGFGIMKASTFGMLYKRALTVELGLHSAIDVFVVKKCLDTPMMNLAFFIRESRSGSLLRRGVMMDPGS